MEHKLILGGEQYLPFARSRIKVLQATGLRYASQRFVLPDATIAVRIEPGQEYIHITGGGCILEMDSGMMNLSSIAPLNPDRYLPGVLIEVGSAVAYNAPFIDTSKGYRAHRGETGQLSGAVTKTKAFAGKIFDAPKSFKPRQIDADPPTVPQTKVPDPADDNLYAKKLTAVLCPPSIFTGKCRLYVQAMYGLPLTPDYPPLTVVSFTSAAPALVLPAYVWPRESHPDILLDTSCGVYLDQMTGQHWLFNPTGNELRIYPLRANKCAEPLRPLLKSDSALNLTDRDRLEAYILSVSRPDVKHAHAAKNTMAGAGNYSMGYGWHWNWDGTKADLVRNDTFDQGDGYNYAMRSTHYRMTMSKAPITEPPEGFGPDDPRVTWTNIVSIIEGPVDWMVARGSWCIAEPNYASMTLSKATPRNSLRFVCDAPFYAFYDRNALKTCRVAVTLHPAGSAYRNMSDSFAASYTYGANDINYRTLGEHDGYLEEGPNSGASYKAVFTVGTEISGEVYEGLTNSGIRHDLTGKYFSNFAGASTDIFFAVETFEFGYPDEFGVWQTETVTRNSVISDTGTGGYDLTLGYFEDRTSGLATVVIPFYDAEAAYLQWNNTYSRLRYGDERRYNFSLAGFNFLERKQVSVYIPPLSSELRTYLKYDWENGGPSSPGVTLISSTPVSTTTSSPSGAEVLVCRAGVVPATFTHLNEFHNNAVDDVGAQFATLSATDQTAPVLVAPGYAGPVGTNGNEGSAPVLIGWI